MTDPATDQPIADVPSLAREEVAAAVDRTTRWLKRCRDVFGGRVRVGDVSGRDLLSRYPRLILTAEFEDIDLGRAGFPAGGRVRPPPVLRDAGVGLLPSNLKLDDSSSQFHEERRSLPSEPRSHYP